MIKYQTFLDGIGWNPKNGPKKLVHPMRVLPIISECRNTIAQRFWSRNWGN